MNYFNTGNKLVSDTGLQMNNVEILYSKVQRIYIKSELKEERQIDLRINVEIHAGLSPVCRKSLCVMLSDDHNPCFLYSLFISEDDFKILKSQQGLLVDFENFATQLINLLEQCQTPVSLNMSKTPKFLLLLTEELGNWSFKVVETNNFKQLCHLSLIISPAKDADIKTHMALKIKHLKDSVVQKDREINNLESNLKDLSGILEVKTRDMEQIEQKYITEKTQFHMNLQQQSSMEQERLTQAKMEWQHETEKERMKIEQKHKETVRELRGENAELRAENSTLKEKVMMLEANNNEQNKQFQIVEQDLAVTQRELSQIRKHNSKLDMEYHEKDKAVNALRTRVAVLEQELKDKTILITKHTEMLKDTKEQKQYLEDLLGEKENQLKRKQTSIKNLSDELMKANEILGKLQNELSSTKSKLKLRTSIALEQERLLDAKQKEVGQLETKLETHVKKYQDVKTELESVKDSLKSLQMQIEEKEKIIKNNDNVISWLNRRITENHVPLHSHTTMTSSNPPVSSVHLGLQRVTNKYLNPSSTNFIPQTMQPDYLSKTNPYLNIDHINRYQMPSMPLTSNGMSSLSNLHRGGLISSTSTPLDRMTVLNNKLSNNIDPITSTANENSNPNPLTMKNSSTGTGTGTKSKITSNTMQGGLKRVTNGKNLPNYTSNATQGGLKRVTNGKNLPSYTSRTKTGYCK